MAGGGPVGGPTLKVLVAVLSARVRPYPALVAAARRTWASVDEPATDVVFYYGGAPRTVVRGRKVLLPVDDDLWHTSEKTIAFFEHALRHLDFDLVFRTNCSSYIDLPNLRLFVDAHAEPERYYAGATGTHEGVRFATGSGFFLSRDLVRLSVDLRDEWDHRFHDDLALAQVLARHRVFPRPLARRDYAAAVDLPDDPFRDSVFHFRCKSETPYRAGDIETMWALHRVRLRTRGETPAPASDWRQKLTVFILRRVLPVAAGVKRAGRAAHRAVMLQRARK